jgi:hypothetical protein
MRTIIAGSRDITDYDIIKQAVLGSGFEITEVVSGCARGVDQMGERWANEHGVPIAKFPANWNDIDIPGAVAKTNKYGKKYNAVAGHWRNAKMAKHADALIAIWDGKSRGTKNMIDLARKRGLQIFIDLGKKA